MGLSASRLVTVVLVDSTRTVLGALAPFEVGLPWWQETGELVTEARSRYGVDLAVLRLLRAEHAVPHGGAVTYLAQVDGAVDAPLTPVEPDLVALALRDEPLRASYAEIDGPRHSLEWAADVLGEPVTAQQQRTWNLSAIWRLRTASGRIAWLKQVPSFFAHEAAVLQWLERTVPGLGPDVIAVGDDGRMLLGDVAGVDLYDADAPTRMRIAEQAHRFQVAASSGTSTRAAMDELVALGVPDRRGDRLSGTIRSALEGWIRSGPQQALLDGLEQRLADLDTCGIPDTLVHGDAHPGNVRRDGPSLVLLDWGDSFLGHPGFDALGLVTGLTETDERVVLGAWASLWAHTLPGVDPERALDLLRPLAALRSAAVYADFVALIEPTERPFHASDVPAMLEAAVQATNA